MSGCLVAIMFDIIHSLKFSTPWEVPRIEAIF